MIFQSISKTDLELYLNYQELDLQLDALKDFGVILVIFIDKISGAKSSRPGLDKCLEILRAGDVLVVCD